MKKNYYAIEFPDGEKQIVDSWSECQQKIIGVANVNFKGFFKREDAENWLWRQLKNQQTTFLNSIKVYVDGSFRTGNSHAAWGYVVVKNDNILHQDSGLTNKPALSRNIDGEVEATIKAIEWGIAHNENLIIYYDYLGIECWAKGTWKAKSPIAIYYQRFIKNIPIEVKFVKVKSHSGDKYNEIADALAKNKLKNLKTLENNPN